jgi:AcrR family transcriptional regulator
VNPSARIAAELRERIRSGDLAPGARVPSTRELTRSYGVALATAARALALLRDEGWVVTRPRSATVVAARPPRRPHRGPRGVVARGDLVDAALRIADDEGLGAVTMRRLATTLGVPTMSVYGSLAGKDDLTSAMIDQALAGAVPTTRPAGGWRDRLALSARAQWAAYRRHPWLARVVSLTRPQLVPSLLRIGEWNLRALETTGLDATARFDVHLLLCNYVRGIAVNLDDEAGIEADTGLDADTWADLSREVRANLTPERYPALARVGAYPFDLDRLFGIGLDRLLDGIAEGMPARR